MRLETKDLEQLGERLARMWAERAISRALTAGAEPPPDGQRNPDADPADGSPSQHPTPG